MYRLVGWLTLARLYRPLDYSLIDPRQGRLLVLAIGPYFAAVVFLATYSAAHFSPLVPRYPQVGDGSRVDYGQNNNGYFGVPFLGDEIAERGYVQLYVPLEWNGYRYLETCGEEATLRRELVGEASVESAAVIEANRALSDCLAGLFAVTIDGVPVDSLSFAFVGVGANGVTAATTLLPTRHLSAGAHYAGIAVYKGESSGLESRREIPFLVPATAR